MVIDPDGNPILIDPALLKERGDLGRPPTGKRAGWTFGAGFGP